MHARLLDEQPDQVPVLHRRASAWYEQYGELQAAIHHALAASDFERAADCSNWRCQPCDGIGRKPR